MFTVLYRWKIREGFERQFEEGWTEVTEHFLANAGSLGSRLHKGNDGIWYAYAQWPSREQRDLAFFGEEIAEASRKMKDAVEERFPETELEIVADRLSPAG